MIDAREDYLVVNTFCHTRLDLLVLFMSVPFSPDSFPLSYDTRNEIMPGMYIVRHDNDHFFAGTETIGATKTTARSSKTQDPQKVPVVEKEHTTNEGICDPYT